ncbi:MAG: AbrB/MazE/SpoVT family DNA-binding domain-containing protein [Chloroflexota bacterium]
MENNTNTKPQQFTVPIRANGQITIPRKLRESLAIEDGDTLTLMQIGDVLLVTSQAPRTYKLADKIADMLDSEDITMADLLVELPKIRSEIYEERGLKHDA